MAEAQLDELKVWQPWAEAQRKAAEEAARAETAELAAQEAARDEATRAEAERRAAAEEAEAERKAAEQTAEDEVLRVLHSMGMMEGTREQAEAALLPGRGNGVAKDAVKWLIYGGFDELAQAEDESRPQQPPQQPRLEAAEMALAPPELEPDGAVPRKGELLRQSHAAASQAPETQPSASEDELVFEIDDGVFLASRFGAASREVIEAMGIKHVINITNGDSRQPHHFEGEGVEYVHYELADQPGENILPRGIREGTRLISEWRQQGGAVMVHCMAGLSRSATVVAAWYMVAHNKTLREAVAHVSERRGRRVRINPTFWMALTQWERELFDQPSGTKPSYDFAHGWVEHFAPMGFDAAKIEAALQKGDWVDFEAAFAALLEE